MSTQTKTNALPEIPDEIAQNKPRALTAYAAEELNAGEVLTEQGMAQIKRPGASSASKATKTPPTKKNTASGKKNAVPAPVSEIIHNPLAGMTAAQIDEVRSRQYTNAPEMDPSLGDLTPEFMKWLRKTHPKDAAIRYAYRGV